MSNCAEYKKSRLTVINGWLLRATNEDWTSPTEVIQRIQGKALDLLLSVPTGSKSTEVAQRRALLLFDCFLRVIDEPPLTSSLTFATPRFQELQLLFYGALGSSVFTSFAQTTRVALAYNFYSLIKALGESVSVASPKHKQGAAKPIPQKYIDSFEMLILNDQEVQSLQPYLLTAKSGTDYNVLIGELIPVIGFAFTTDFHQGLRAIARPKAKDTALRDFGTTFARFATAQHTLGKDLSPELLKQPVYVQNMLVDFMEFHFTKMARMDGRPQEGTLGSLQKLWSRYINYWAQLERQGVVAAPSFAYPAGNPKLLSGAAIGHRKVATDEDGNTKIITHKLLTPVPLHLSDDAATKLVFESIKTDFAVVQSWVRDHIEAFFHDYEAGCSLADKIDVLPPNDKLQPCLTSKRLLESSFALALKYFKEVHGGYVDTNVEPTLAYPLCAARGGHHKTVLARFLGIPCRTEAMAFMAYLVSLDGRFTESALATAKLFDKRGRRINAVHTDAGLTLSVLKERDATGGWQDAILNDEGAALVLQWIKVTAPIRNYMKKKNIEGWHNLIIYTGAPLGTPSYFTRASNIHSTFRNFARAHRWVLGDLADYVTIPRIRSTRGVLAFLENMNLTEMARELGNTNETSMRHYLPDSLWEYFSVRWLRIFQNLLIVEATKDTPYMQRALRFGTAEEMDEFLKTHALKPLIPDTGEETVSGPHEAAAPASMSQQPSELMVAASPGIFSILLSVAEAVSLTSGQGKAVCQKAQYWAEFMLRIQSHIESDSYPDRNIKQMLATAKGNVNPAHFMGVVCA